MDDLEAMPDDGSRYEIIDGEIFVTPAPIFIHQRAQMELVARLLGYTRLLGLELLVAPTAVRASESTEVQPDLLVLSQAPPSVAESRWVAMPTLVLAVEILSAATSVRDRGMKRRTYLMNGVSEYWIVDLQQRAVDVWRAGAELAEARSDTLVWQPLQAHAPVSIDLHEYFNHVFAEA